MAAEKGWIHGSTDVKWGWVQRLDDTEVKKRQLEGGSLKNRRNRDVVMWTTALRCEIDGVHGVARSATRVFTQWKPGSRVCYRAGSGVSLGEQARMSSRRWGVEYMGGGILMGGLLRGEPPGLSTMRSLTSVGKSSDLCWKEQATVPMFQARPKWRQNVLQCIGGLGSGVRREGNGRATMPTLQNGCLMLGNQVILQA
ncbi:hypothetical protein B0H17DRAFT_1123939 [Mycena rosella]|uniref:Uncharacterized protein n=1 Tax=Mycena rosella TaxID=1033263 RepID=A0AAD7H2R7_MYCRO|nr:hypothetical protein B0H17DRAFT_1123939 [Mycena rosella]